jgi:hypothetical protein
MTQPKQTQAVSETLATVVLSVLAAACAALLLAQPREVEPVELPSLSLPAGAVQAVMRADIEAARTAPHGATIDAYEALLEEQGQSEVRGTEAADSYIARRRELTNRYKSVQGAVGEKVALRLREKALQRFEDALEMRLPLSRAKVILGAMTSVLAAEGASRDGYLVAPRFVVRTLYKARWNILAGLPADADFAPIERRAFYGWQALQSEHLTLQKRVEALHTYGLAGGDHVEEALGVLLFRLGDYKQSASALQVAYEREGSLRLRNYLLAARAAAGAIED